MPVTRVGAAPGNVLTLSHVTERDVDLLLVEELQCSEPFRRMVYELCVGKPGFETVRSFHVLHDVRHHGKQTGQTDILLVFDCQRDCKPHRVALLLEDKVDAAFMQTQPQRYQARARSMLSTQAAQQCLCVLFAPQEYLETAPEAEHFDTSISYEQLLDHFRLRAKVETGELQARLAYRAQVIEQALLRYRRGYNAVVDETCTQFFKEYHKLACHVAPSLHMRPPGGKPAGSSFVIFSQALARSEGLPAASLKHKLHHGRVDLELKGRRTELPRLRELLVPCLPAHAKLRVAGLSAAVSLAVPSADMLKPFMPQGEAIRTGLHAALELQRWWDEHAAVLRQVVTHEVTA